MVLSSELISEFAKITNDKETTKKESTMYGTVVDYNGSLYARIDGTDQLTPITQGANTTPGNTTSVVQNGDRITITIKDHIATVTGNTSSPSPRIEDVQPAIDASAKIDEMEIVLADKVSTAQLEAEKARITTLESDKLDVKDATATYATIENLEATNASIRELEAGGITTEQLDARYATIENLNATNADLDSLESDHGNFKNLTTNNFTAVIGEINKLDANKVSTEQLDAEKARISNLETEVGDIDTLIFGSATGSTIQTSFANAVIAQLGGAQIKSAMIENISASKITAGDIITNNVRVKSQNGLLLISDETIQISDETRVRVQIGKDAAGDYSINIWDANGKLMFSEGGITDSAIKDAIIRNDMVSDTANIAAHKLDIDSLFEEINGSSNTIKSTKIYLDDKSQTLDVAFKELTTEVSETSETISSQGTQISAIQGQIDSKVWKQDIDAISIGGRNLLLDTDFGDDPWRTERPEGTERTEFGFHFYPSVEIELGEEYTVSARIRGNANIVFYEITDNTNKSHFWLLRDSLDETEFRHFSFTFTADANYGRLIDAYICTQWGEGNTLVGDWFEIESRSVKLEKGNKATDWTLAPEDTKGVLSSLSDQYSTLNQSLTSVSATVASHTTDIAAKADNTTVTEIDSKVGSLELSYNQFQTTVSETYATKTELNDVNSDVETVESRVATAETKINQNGNSIASLVSRTEVIEGNYTTTSQMNSAVEQKADSIMSSVSSTYATIAAVDAAQADVDNLKIGGRNLLPNTDFGDVAQRYERLESYGTEGGFHFYPTEQIESGVEYVLSLSIRGNANIVFYEINTSGGNMSHAWMRRASLSEEEYRDFYLTFTVDTSRTFGNVYICTQYGEDATFVGDWFEIKPRSLKLERGNRKTDWTPAPEDTATTDDVEAVQHSIESTEERIAASESVIQQLSDSIMTLVTDGNGESLMVQTENGWTFSTGELQDIVNTTSENLDILTNDVGDINSTVDILQQTVDDLGILNDYVKITTYEDEPCIELGETDSDFKLLITNTRIMFMEGTSVIAYINNQSLFINKTVIEEELQQGEFVWKARSNGNLGLIWKGATS